MLKVAQDLVRTVWIGKIYAALLMDNDDPWIVSRCRT